MVTAFLASSEFVEAAAAQGGALGYAQVPVVFVAHPIQDRTDAEMARLAEDALDAVLKQSLSDDRLPSLVLWGPPGCGKTSFATCVAATTRRIFRSLSAAKVGVSELRDELARAANASRLRGLESVGDAVHTTLPR